MLNYSLFNSSTGNFPASQGALVLRNPPANAGDMRCGFNPWVGKIPWRRARQPTPVSLCGESQEQGSLVAYSPLGRTESDMTEATYHTAHTGNSVSTFSRGRQNNTQSFLKWLIHGIPNHHKQKFYTHSTIPSLRGIIKYWGVCAGLFLLSMYTLKHAS